ncbi:MAG: acyltransferase family protein [Paracoccaceae bacterium]
MRTDIQALRGIAVCFVLFYHAGIGGVSAGFLGVDIFFVISGFLITGIVAQALKTGTFSFRDFYIRRARRLLPAAFVVLAICGALSGYFLTRSEQIWFHEQVVGSLFFVANFVLLDQIDYFATAADQKPLLHMWSLAIEEQYYALLPAALFFLRPAWWGRALLGVVVVSFAGCVVIQFYAPAHAFYLLPTRAWELCLGSVGAVYAVQLRGNKWVQRAALPAVVVLTALPFFPTGAPHPGLDALLVCIATLILLMRRDDTTVLPVQVLARIGDMSYALYLVHWPIFAFAKNVYVSSTVPADVRAGLLALSLILSYMLYRLVEQPFRQHTFLPNFRLVGLGGSVIAAVALIPFLSAANWSGDVDFREERRTNWGFDEACEYKQNFFSRSECRNSEPDKVHILVWGDSFGMHVVPGIAAQHGPGVEQATRNACAPILGLAPRNDASYTRPWAEFCLEFQHSVRDYIESSSAEIVVLSTPITHYVDEGASLLVQTGEGLTEVEGDVGLTLEHFRATVAAIRALGKRVIVISAPPRADYALPECMVRKATGRLVRGYFSDCRLSMEIYREAAPASVEFFGRLEEEADVPVIRLEDFMCPEDRCMTDLDGVMLYRDRIHLSVNGSIKLAQAMDWLGEIQERAR